MVFTSNFDSSTCFLTMINLASPGPRMVQSQGDLSCPEEGKQYQGNTLSGYPVTTDTVEACAAL